MTELTNPSDQQNITTVLGKPQSWHKFSAAQEFSKHIIEIAKETGETCTDTILNFCSAHSLEPQDIANKITLQLKSILEDEYKKIGYLKKK